MRDLLCRNIMNIIDVKHHQKYVMFDDDRIEDILYQYLLELKPECKKNIDDFMEVNRCYIQSIAKDDLSLEDNNLFFENLREFKRQYLM